MTGPLTVSRHLTEAEQPLVELAKTTEDAVLRRYILQALASIELARLHNELQFPQLKGLLK